MLYDKKWNTKPSLKGMITWLERQNPNKTYVFHESDGCAASQYLYAIGVQRTSGLLSYDIDVLFKKAGVGSHFATSRTFGELLNKLKTLV